MGCPCSGGTKKSLNSPGLCVTVIIGSSRLIPLWLLWPFGKGQFSHPSLGFCQLAVKDQSVPEVQAVRSEVCAWGVGEDGLVAQTW